MPLYEYECKQCHQRVEKIQSFNAPPETICPKCGGPLERVISAPAFQFKGTGWYVSDYAKSGTKPAAGDPKAPGSADISASSSEKADGEKKSPASSSAESASSSSESPASTAASPASPAAKPGT